MAVLRLTLSVKLHRADGQPLAPAGLRLLGVLEQVAREEPEDVVITCGTEGHATGAHPRGEAFDVRTRDLSPETILRRYRRLTRLLGPAFTVLYEVPAGAGVRDPRLSAILYPSGSASAEHFHLQLRKGYGVWPSIIDRQINTAPV